MDKRALKSLIGGSVLLLFLGIIYVWSQFSGAVRFHLNWTSDATKLTGNVMACFFVGGILIGGILGNKVKPKILVLIGGLMLAAGVFLTSFVTKDAPQLIYVTYGAAGGFGVGMAYNTILACAQKWFPAKRGMAIGVSVCSFGLSTVILAPIVISLIGKVTTGTGGAETFVAGTLSVPNTFRVLAAMFAVATLVLFSFISQPEVINSSASDGSLGEDKTLPQALKTRNFYLIFGLMFVANAPYLISFPMFRDLAKARGIEDLATAMVMITGIASAAGRLIWPLTAKKLTARGAALIGCIVTAVCAVLLYFVQGIPLIVVIAIITFFFGGFSGVNPVLTSNYFGLKYVSSVYGAIMVGYMMSSLVFPIVLGGASELVRYMTLAGLGVIGAVFMLLLKKNQKKA